MYINNIEKELYELYQKYQDFDFITYYDKIIKNTNILKYSKGLGFMAGLYEPSYVTEIMCTNQSIGREVKNIDKGFNYKYFFDENNKIILSEKYLDGKIKYLNFYFYEDKILEFICYSLNNGFYSLSKSYYDKENRIIKHIGIPVLFMYNPIENNIYEEHIFKYLDDETFITYIKYTKPTKEFKFIKEKKDITNMKIKDNILYYIDEENNIKGYHHIRFKLDNGNKIEIPLPKKVPVFKIIKENMIEILNKWKSLDISVIWINCENTDLTMQYTTEKNTCEEKWNIAYYEDNEEAIFKEQNHIQTFEDLLFNNNCNIDDLIDESEYFVNKMVKIIKELRKEEIISSNTAIILSTLEITSNTITIAKKINNREIIKDFPFIEDE